MAFTPAQDEWQVATSTSPATGPAVTPGNVVIARAIHRAGSNTLPAEISDNGSGNVWHPVGNTSGGQYIGVVAGGSGDLYYWWCVPTTPFTEVSVVVGGNPATGRTLFVAEWQGNATTDVLLDAAWLANPSMVGPLPAALVETSAGGALVSGALGATVSNRTFTLLTAGYTAGREHKASQTTLISAARPAVEPGTHGPQWELGGSSSTTAVITAMFRPAGSGTAPAEATAAGDVTWTGTATAATTHAAAAAGGHAWLGSANAAAVHEVAAAGGHAWAGAADTATTHQAAAAGGHAWAGTVDAKAHDVDSANATAVGGHTWTGTATAARGAQATTDTGHTWAGHAATARAAKAAAAGGHAWAATATTTALAPAGNTATAVGGHTWHGTTNAARPSRATVTGSHTWATTVDATTAHRATATTVHQWTGAAATTQHAGRDITLTLGPTRGHPLTVTSATRHALTHRGSSAHPLTITDTRS